MMTVSTSQRIPVVYLYGFLGDYAIPMASDDTSKVKKPKGFAAMTPTARSRISSAGGKAAQKAGTAHRFTPEEAMKAGQIGGKVTAEKRARGE